MKLRQEQMNNIDWAQYAQQYDLMAANNPAYQELVHHCRKTVMGWSLKPGETIADFGAGTGNFSIELASVLPSISVLHVDVNNNMIEIAQRKAIRSGLKNWHVVYLDLDSETWELPVLTGAVSIHTIYTVQTPQRFISQLCSLTRPGGYIYACDLGRKIDVFDWAKYLMRASLKSNGVLETYRLLTRSKIIRRQNKEIARCQKSGKFWLHNLSEFRALFEEEDIQILFASNEFYRRYDDLIIGRKKTP